jgi:hypothetical protein
MGLQLNWSTASGMEILHFEHKTGIVMKTTDRKTARPTSS